MRRHTSHSRCRTTDKQRAGARASTVQIKPGRAASGGMKPAAFTWATAKAHRIRALRQRAAGVSPSNPPHDALPRPRATAAW